MKNKTYIKRIDGFTLTEIVVVVLIIGILTAVALPLFRRAIDETRFSKLVPVAKSIKTAEEAFLLSNGKYTSDLLSLDVGLADVKEENGFFFFGGDMKLSLNAESTHENVRLAIDGLNNRYVSYFDKSAHFPGEIHCEALIGDSRAQSLCDIMGGTEMGTTGSYTTYLLMGAGAGTLTDAPARVTSTGKCKENNSSSCVRTEYDDGSFTETSSTVKCLYNSAGQKTRCMDNYNSTSFTVTEYDPVSGKTTKKVKYSNNGSKVSSITEYDEEGRVIKITSGGTGKWFNTPNTTTTIYEYDPQTGKKIGETHYRGGYPHNDYQYDPETGELVYHANYNAGNGNLNYVEEYKDGKLVGRYEFDSQGNLTDYDDGNLDISFREYYYDDAAGTVDSVSGYDENGDYYRYSYDSNGNVTSASDDRNSYSYNSNGNLTYVRGEDENGNSQSISYRSDGSISSSWGYDEDGNSYDIYFDADGNLTSYNSYDYENNRDTSYNSDGSVQYTSSFNEDDWTYDGYYYNQDGSFSHRIEDDMGEIISATYYDKDGNFTGAADYDNTYKYDSNGQLSSVTENDYGMGYDVTYNFNSDGSLSSVGGYDDSYGDYEIVFNQDGSVNYEQSNAGYYESDWDYEYDSREDAIDAIVSYGDFNSTTASDFPSYDSWDTSSSTVTQESWGKADTSTWPSPSDMPSADSYPSADSWPPADTWPSQDSIETPEYDKKGLYNNTVDADKLNNNGTYCENYPDDEKC